MATETLMPGDVILNDYPVQTSPFTIVSGAGVLARGTVLGEITASKKLKTSATAASDGSQKAKVVLAVNVDATAADVVAACYVSGGFDGNKLIYGAGHTAATVEADFRAADAPLFVKTPK